jgi:CheY-like chemotaxis protein
MELLLMNAKGKLERTLGTPVPRIHAPRDPVPITKARTRPRSRLALARRICGTESSGVRSAWTGGENSFRGQAGIVSIASRAFFPDPDDHPATVLVVEDEVLIRMAIAAYLQECGFRVLEAGSAEEAIQILDVDLMPVDLVFSDVAMPGTMDGFGLARWIHDRRPDVQVALTSGRKDCGDIARDLPNHERFFAKPYDVGEVARELKHMLDVA